MTEAEKRQVAGILLAAWLAEHHPEVFARLQAQVAGTAAPPVGLAGFTDTLSSIWGGITSAATKVASGLSSAVKSVGSFIASPQGSSTLAQLGTAYYGAKTAQSSAIIAQAERAQAGQTPAPINTVYDPQSGTYVPVLSQPQAGGLMSNTPLNYQMLQSLRPSALQEYAPWLIAGGVGILALVLLRR